MRKPITLIATTGVIALGVAASAGAGGHASAAVSTGAHRAAVTAAASSSAPVSARAAAMTTRLTISAKMSGALMFSTSSLKAKAGTVIITFVNHAPEGHNLTVIRGTRGTKLGATPTFHGGSKVLTLHLKAGRYTYYCSVPGHRQSGMQGTLTVS